jgi:hypothetical protein
MPLQLFVPSVQPQQLLLNLLVQLMSIFDILLVLSDLRLESGYLLSQ